MEPLSHHIVAEYMKRLRGMTIQRLKERGFLVINSDEPGGLIRVIIDELVIRCGEASWEMLLCDSMLADAVHHLVISIVPCDYPIIGCYFQPLPITQETIVSENVDFPFSQLLRMANHILEVRASKTTISAWDGSVLAEFHDEGGGCITIDGRDITSMVSQATISLHLLGRIVEISVRFGGYRRGSIGDGD